MITCPVCGTKNDDLALLCSSCRSFLQAKVESLDLFHTIWSLIESPRAAFKRIVLSRHKNYVFLLSSLLGISILYTVLWYKNLGRLFSNVVTLTGTGLVAGPPVGVVFTLVFSAILLRITRTLGGRATLRDTFAVVAYASVPISFALVLVYPIEIAIFGLYFFDRNPPPLVINPVAYLVLLGFDVVTVAWSWLLLVEGTVVANGFVRKRAVLITLAVLALTGLAGYGLRFV